MLARLVGRGAGRSAEVRVKLYLTLLFLAREDGAWAAERKPAAAWAWLFGLDDPEKAGAQRVSNAIRAMHDAGEIVADQRQGREPSLRPCLETGHHVTWRSPVGAAGQTIAEEDRHWQLDRGFWECGWISVLSSRAIAALCVLMDATWGWDSDQGEPIELETGLTVRPVKSLRWYHVTDDQLSKSYGISRDLFDRGIKELLSWNLVESKLRPTRMPGGVRRWSTTRARFYRELRVRLEVLRSPMVELAEGKTPARVAHSKEFGILINDVLGSVDSASSIDELLGAPSSPAARGTRSGKKGAAKKA